MLWKYFQNCMHSFREDRKINLTIWRTVPPFNPYCLQFHWNRKYFCSAILRLRGRLLMVPWHGSYLFDKERYMRVIPSRKNFPWLAYFSSISAVIFLLFKKFYQDNKFFYLKSISSFSISVCSKKFQNFCYCNAI